jgi:hypothetical protein
MQLIGPTLLTALCLAAGPAQAASCTLLPLLSGTLTLSADGQRMGSEEGGGLPATISITTIGGATVTVSAPVLYEYPVDYSASGDLLEVAYTGVGLLSGANQTYTSQATNFAAPSLITPVVLTVQNRVTTASGFESGTYRTRTTITCS